MTSMTARAGTPSTKLEHRRRRVPGIVQPGVPHPGVGEYRLPLLVVGSGVDRPPVGLGEHPALLAPLGTGRPPLFGLRHPMCHDDSEARHRDDG